MGYRSAVLGDKPRLKRNRNNSWFLILDRLESMAVFVKAADLGSFAATAEALGMSGPMVGKHVQSLEARLNARLINRTTRRQSLTEVGRAYYDRCKRVLGEAEAADAFVTDTLTGPRGRLRVAMPVHLGRRCVVPILLELATRHPALELELCLSDRLVDLADDAYDIAIRTGTLTDSASLIARRLTSQRMVVCAAPSYLASHGRPERVEDLGAHDAVVYRRSGPVPPWLFPRQDQPPLESRPSSRLRLDDLDAIADVAAAGLGLAWLPFWLVRDRIGAGALVELLPDVDTYPYDVHALWLRTPHLPLRVRLAIDLLASELPKAMD